MEITGLKKQNRLTLLCILQANTRRQKSTFLARTKSRLRHNFLVQNYQHKVITAKNPRPMQKGTASLLRNVASRWTLVKRAWNSDLHNKKDNETNRTGAITCLLGCFECCKTEYLYFIDQIIRLFCIWLRFLWLPAAFVITFC